SFCHFHGFILSTKNLGNCEIVLARMAWGGYGFQQSQRKGNPDLLLFMKTKILPFKVSSFQCFPSVGLARGAVLGCVAAMIASPAQAAFHLWNIREIYTDTSGSLQFVELFCAFG